MWKRAAKPAWAFQGKKTEKELGLMYLGKQKLRMYMVTFPVFIESKHQRAISAERQGLAADSWMENRSKPGRGIKAGF